ncbi:hypothetical protein ACIRU3_26150 [Streptomyces sp. NPDC101151]
MAAPDPMADPGEELPVLSFDGPGRYRLHIDARDGTPRSASP